MANVEVLTPEDLALMDATLPTVVDYVDGSLVTVFGPLTADILAEGSKVALTSGQERLVDFNQLRARHHRVAQLMAAGIKDVTISRIVGLSTPFICNLKTSPAFLELLAHYQAEVTDQFSDFVQSAAELSQVALDEIRERLESEPKQFSVNQLLEVVKTTADRSGNAPVARSVSINASVDMGSKLAAARQRGMAVLQPPDGG